MGVNCNLDGYQLRIEVCLKQTDYETMRKKFRAREPLDVGASRGTTLESVCCAGA